MSRWRQLALVTVLITIGCVFYLSPTIISHIQEFSNSYKGLASAEWAVVITLMIALYGALLSTYSIWVSKQEHKREVKVTLSYGFIRNALSTSRTLLFISALNTGEKTATLTSMGLILPKKDRSRLTFLSPNSYESFPHDLLEGKKCSVWVTTQELAEDLKREGYSGKIGLRGYFTDAIGREYRSKSTKFDIETP